MGNGNGEWGMGKKALFYTLCLVSVFIMSMCYYFHKNTTTDDAFEDF